ncbi:hypothetical protein [Legionella worsleiensis]|uniref:Uncharacterized protein n=1 Tax=Legionella worsleiensis TaxID=45076 RepID=A0A0W1A694_9GAMM|nr:hypothetical protein [Legionella worsleiensis]KTD76776.1 hypothetical protein Lwor_2001 [Legionella worsleiensis]STY30594.1 Uncharacterised protein [Legionella worsleiensis]
MNHEFKKLLLKIAVLPKKDQRWILSQLTAQQQKQFEQNQGNELLHKAQHFRSLAHIPLKEVVTKPQIPSLCDALKHQDSLYIAIILEQGQFNWQKEFITLLDNGDEIHELMDTQVTKIKPDTKLSLFRQWQIEHSFDEQLVMHYG